MPIRKLMKSVPSDILAAEGILSQDVEALTPYQRECMRRMAMTLQLEQEAYLSKHPELIAMMELFIAHVSGLMKRNAEPIKQGADFFLRPMEKLDGNIRKRLGIGPNDPYALPDKPILHFYDDEKLINDLIAIGKKHFPPPSMSGGSSDIALANTESSSFLSVQTSDTTLPTPEPILTPQPTLSETMFNFVQLALNKAVFLHVDEADLRYDTAYVALAEAVEQAMEIPVMEIRQEIAELFSKAYKLFELDIMEKEKRAAAIAWEKRIRKKMKRTLRRQENFKGYESPSTPKSSISAHENYLKPPPKPCVCHPAIHYNRYQKVQRYLERIKDRFGIYLPSPTFALYDGANVTATPVISTESMLEDHKSETQGSVTSKNSNKSSMS